MMLVDVFEHTSSETGLIWTKHGKWCAWGRLTLNFFSGITPVDPLVASKRVWNLCLFVSGVRCIVLITCCSPVFTKLDVNTWVNGHVNQTSAIFWQFFIRGCCSPKTAKTGDWSTSLYGCYSTGIRFLRWVSASGVVEGERRSPKYFVGGTPFPHLLSGHGGTLIQ